MCTSFKCFHYIGLITIHSKSMKMLSFSIRFFNRSCFHMTIYFLKMFYHKVIFINFEVETLHVLGMDKNIKLNTAEVKTCMITNDTLFNTNNYHRSDICILL